LVDALVPLAKDVLAIIGGMALVGIVCGVIWSHVVHPAQMIRYDKGIGQDEVELSKMFAMDGWYAVISAVAALGCGLFFGFTRHRDPLATLLLVVLGCVAAAYLTKLTGHVLGPGDPVDVLRSAPVGARADVRLDVQGGATYLAWPIPALFGNLLALMTRAD
jgi:hypothetical protein